jgi:DNA-binding response OmpR family regulator
MRILVVDDEPLVRRALERAFSLNGHHVESAADGHAGWQMWVDAEFDLVLLDVLMPNLTGPQVIEKMGRERTGKVVLMSAFSADYATSETYYPEADLFLAKPFENIFSLVEQCEQLVQKLKVSPV